MLLAQVDDLCDAYPEIRLSTLDELAAIVSTSIFLLGFIFSGKNLRRASEAAALRRAWVENWTPYQSIPGTYLTSRIVPAEIQDRICGVLTRTVALAEESYKEESLEESYGDLLKVLNDLRARVASPAPSVRGGGVLLFFVGAVIAAGAIGVGLAHLRGHRRSTAP